MGIKFTKLELEELLSALASRQSDLRNKCSRDFSHEEIERRVSACAMVAYKLGKLSEIEEG
jgi:hypothetical protein